MVSNNEDDHALIKRYLQNEDDEALRHLFSRYAGQIHRFLARFVGSMSDAEDMAQETFVKAWRHLARVDERSFKTWLFSIARNVGRDWLRKRRATSFTDFDDAEGNNAVLDNLEDTADLPDEVLMTKESIENVRAAIAALSPSSRAVVLLRHDGELSFEEIAQATDEPMNTVKSRYRRALQELKKRLPGS